MADAIIVAAPSSGSGKTLITLALLRALKNSGLRAYLHALEHGVLLRPLGDVIYFMPPYVISADEIDLMVDVATTAIEAAL